MKMHNDPHSWQGWLELFQSWWRGDTPLGAVLMSLFMAGLRIAYFGGSGGWKKKTLEILLCGALTLTFSSALEYFGWPKSPVCCNWRWCRPYRRGCYPGLRNEVYRGAYRWGQ